LISTLDPAERIFQEKRKSPSFAFSEGNPLGFRCVEKYRRGELFVVDSRSPARTAPHVDHDKWMLVSKKSNGAWKTQCDF